MHKILATLLVVAALGLNLGCQPSLPATVSGQVTIDGEPLPEGANTTGEVMFYPAGGGAPAYGEMKVRPFLQFCAEVRGLKGAAGAAAPCWPSLAAGWGRSSSGPASGRKPGGGMTK